MLNNEDFSPECKKTLWVVQDDVQVYSGKIESTCSNDRVGKTIQIKDGGGIQSVTLDKAFYTEIEAYAKALDMCKDNIHELKGKKIAAEEAIDVEIQKLEIIRDRIENFKKGA